MEDQPNIKEIIKAEFLRCSQDPIYFMKKYCYVQHPMRGRVLFHLYLFQEKVLKLCQEHNYVIINKSRQLGISTLSAGYSLWLMLFNKDKNILCIATKQETAKNMVTKVKFMYDNLPSWLKVPTLENNKLTLKLTNGSQIKAVSAASDSGRSEAVSLLLIDEAAFIEGIGEIWASAQQTLATGGGCIAISTPYGTGNWFHKTFTAAENNENDFLPIKLPWFVHPERDQAWRNKQDELLGDFRLAAQECDADFSTSGDVVFYPEWIELIRDTTIKEPLEKRGVDKNLWIWEPTDYSRNYMIIADVARGDGKDYSACHVIDIELNTQVAEYKGQLPPKEFGYFLTGLGAEYNNALLVVEANNIGWACLDAIIERGYKNLYYSSKNEVKDYETYFNKIENSNNSVPGFSTNLRTRPLIIAKLRETIGDRSVIIQSNRLLEEMKIFIWKNGRAEAQSGYNDDLVMSFAIGQYLRETSIKFQQQSIDMARAALGNINVNKQTQSGIYNTNNVSNPYIQKVNGKDEDISWLF